MSKILLVGVGGQGMRGLIKFLADDKSKLIGVDQNIDYLPGVEVVPEQAVDWNQIGRVVASDAVSREHGILSVAQAKQIEISSYAEELGRISQQFRVIAVTGTHGKSTTTAMLAHILIEAGLDPNVLIGAPVPAWNHENSRLGNSQWLVLEADEYQNHFLELKRDFAIVTNIKFDHPDFFANQEAVVESFTKFKAGVSEQIIEGDNIEPLEIKLAIPGEHMRKNAAAAVEMAVIVGVERSQAIESLKSWKGLGRRFEALGRIVNINAISDYAHHPDEIEANLETLSEPEKWLVIIEPHLDSRLSTFFEAYIEILVDFPGGIVISPTYVARDDIRSNKSSNDLFRALEKNRGRVWYISHLRELDKLLVEIGENFENLIGFSAGDLDGKLRELTV